MRAAILAVTGLTLTLGVALRPLPAQPPNTGLAMESIDMIDAQIGWAVVRDPKAAPGDPAAQALIRTTDGGSTWRDVTPLDRQKKQFTHFDATNVDVISSLFVRLGSLWTVDGGRTWKAIPISGDITSIHFINPRDGWLLTYWGANSASLKTIVYRSYNGGETWAQVVSLAPYMPNNPLPDVVGGGTHITFVSPTTGWITQRSAAMCLSRCLYATGDGGYTWQRQELPRPSQVAITSLVAMMPPRFFTPRDGILPAFYANRDAQERMAGFVVIYMTHDAGATWSHTTPISISRWRPWSFGPVSFPDINHGWLADEGRLLTTRDGGRHWTVTHSTAFRGVRQLDFISPRIGWAVRTTFPFLLKTADGGLTWAPVAYRIR